MATDHVRPPALPRAVTGVHARAVLFTACPSYFAVVWADFEPLPSDAAEEFVFVDDLPEVCRYPGKPLPREFVEAFGAAVREVWTEEGGGRPVFATRVLLRDAMWHELDSSVWAFEGAGRLAAREVLRCLAESRDPRPVGRGTRGRPTPPMPRTLPPPEKSSRP